MKRTKVCVILLFTSCKWENLFTFIPLPVFWWWVLRDVAKPCLRKKLLLENKDLFETLPTQVHYCYGVWQDRFQPMQDRGVMFHEGIPDHSALVQWFPPGGKGVMVLDDLMDEGSHDKRVLDLFTKHSHHQNVTVIYLCQDMFPVGKYAKSISRNAHCIVGSNSPARSLTDACNANIKRIVPLKLFI